MSHRIRNQPIGRRAFRTITNMLELCKLAQAKPNVHAAIVNAASVAFSACSAAWLMQASLCIFILTVLQDSLNLAEICAPPDASKRIVLQRTDVLVATDGSGAGVVTLLPRGTVFILLNTFKGRNPFYKTAAYFSSMRESYSILTWPTSADLRKGHPTFPRHVGHLHRRFLCEN